MVGETIDQEPTTNDFNLGRTIRLTQPADESEHFNITLILPSGEERMIQVRPGEHIWDAAFRAGIELPALCHQGWCLTCAAQIEGEGTMDQNDSIAYYPEDRAAGYALPCTGKAHSDLRLRTGCARQMRRHRQAHGLPAPYTGV